MKIQVLGSGCPTCKKLHDITQEAVNELGIEEDAEYITGAEGMQKIVGLGVMSSPVLVVNDKVAMVGFTPDISKVKEAIMEADN